MRALTLAILLLLLSVLGASRAAADDIVPSARVSSAVLVREGPPISRPCAPASHASTI